MLNLFRYLAMILLMQMVVGQTLAADDYQTTSLPAGSTIIRSLACDGKGRLWVATFGTGLWVIDASGSQRFFDTATNQPFPMINNLLFTDNSLFIATAGGGCVKLDCDSLKFSPLVQHPGFDKLHGLYKTSSGTIFIGSVGSGTARLRGNSWVPVAESQSTQLAWVNSILEWGNQIWVGTSTGLYKTSTETEQWKPQFAGISRAVNCLLVHENILYAGTSDRGVYALKAGQEPELVAGTMGQIQFLTNFNSQVIAGGELGLWSIENLQAVEVENDISNVKCAVVDAKNFLLIGTMNGKIYSSVDAKHFSLTFAFNENSLQEQK